jgi:hypothetical protein
MSSSGAKETRAVFRLSFDQKWVDFAIPNRVKKHAIRRERNKGGFPAVNV